MYDKLTSHTAFKFLPLSLVFDSLIIICLGEIFFGLDLIRDTRFIYLDIHIFPSHLGIFSFIISINFCSFLFFFFCFFTTHVLQMQSPWVMPHRSCRFSSFLFIAAPILFYLLSAYFREICLLIRRVFFLLDLVYC